MSNGYTGSVITALLTVPFSSMMISIVPGYLFFSPSSRGAHTGIACAIGRGGVTSGSVGRRCASTGFRWTRFRPAGWRWRLPPARLSPRGSRRRTAASCRSARLLNPSASIFKSASDVRPASPTSAITASTWRNSSADAAISPCSKCSFAVAYRAFAAPGSRRACASRYISTSFGESFSSTLSNGRRTTRRSIAACASWGRLRPSRHNARYLSA